jgi:hypothetical protein
LDEETGRNGESKKLRERKRKEEQVTIIDKELLLR